jgi:tetratricopeptide (TPR) repeat protein/DNA-binding XRE family transcriptional regulator
MKSDQPTSFGEVLQNLRKQQKMGQQPLADRLGVHRNTIGAWERGDRLPETRGMVLELARVLRLDDEQTRMLLQASLTGLSSYWQVPSPRNPFFSGRSQLLTHLHHQLSDNQTVALSQSYGITGLGGIGKTQLALEYAYQHAHDYHAVFWISAETIDTIYADFTLIAEHLNLFEGEKQNQQQLVKAVQRWLSTHKDWLLIFDNVEDLSLLRSFLPSARAGAVLVTTRLHALAGLAHTLELSAFPYTDALRFLLVRAHLAQSEQPLDEIPQELLSVARALVTATDGLPLALDQAGAYVEQTGCTLADYLRLFERYPVRLLAERPAVADHPQSVVQTFMLSFEKVEQTNAAASDLLRLCAFLHPDAIPEELLREGAVHWSPALKLAANDPSLLDQTLTAAMQLSLLNRSTNQQTFSLHRLVQTVLLETMSEDEQHSWLQRVIAALDNVFPEEMQATWWRQCERLLPHALLCLQRTDTSQQDLALASMAYKAAQYLRERGRYGEAEPLFRRALRVQEQQLGESHPQVASSLTGLANLYRRQGRYAEAEPLYQRALTIFEQQSGEAHPQMAPSLSGLASLYNEQGKFTEAEPLFLRAIYVQELLLGATHPQLAYPLNGLANLYFHQGKYTEAEPFYWRTISICEQQLGATHFQLAYPLNGLAVLYFEQGRYAEAEPLYQRALAIFEQQLGPEHSLVASLVNNLAELSRNQGHYAEAEQLFHRAIRVQKQLFGEMHPQVAYPLAGLAELYQAQGDYGQAEPLFQQALAIREHTLEPLHPDIAETLHGFALFREAQDNKEEAAALYQRALLIREQVLGPEHLKTSETRQRLYLLLVALSRTEDTAH